MSFYRQLNQFVDIPLSRQITVAEKLLTCVSLVFRSKKCIN